MRAATGIVQPDVVAPLESRQLAGDVFSRQDDSLAAAAFADSFFDEAFTHATTFRFRTLRLHSERFLASRVQAGMRRIARHQLQVLYTIVRPNSVLVMNDFGLEKKAPEMRFHHEPVLAHVAQRVRVRMVRRLDEYVAPPLVDEAQRLSSSINAESLHVNEDRRFARSQLVGDLFRRPPVDFVSLTQMRFGEQVASKRRISVDSKTGHAAKPTRSHGRVVRELFPADFAGRNALFAWPHGN
jgi:hypothetical protein